MAGISTLSGTGAVISQCHDSDAGNNGGALELKGTSGTGMKLGKTRVLERLLVIDDTATFTLSPTYSGSDPEKNDHYRYFSDQLHRYYVR